MLDIAREHLAAKPGDVTLNGTPQIKPPEPLPSNAPQGPQASTAAEPTKLTDLQNPAQVKQWAAENPDKAAELANKPHVALSDLTDAGISATGNRPEQRAFQQRLLEEVSKPPDEGQQPERPFALENKPEATAAAPVENLENTKQDALFPKGGLPGQADFLDQIPDLKREAKTEQPPAEPEPLRELPERGGDNKLFNDAAESHGLHADELRDAAKTIVEQRREFEEMRENAKRDLAQATGLSASELARRQNVSGKRSVGYGDQGDMSEGAAMEVANRYPGLFHGDEKEITEQAYDLLLKGREPYSKPTDRDVLDEAAAMLKSAKEPVGVGAGDKGYPDSWDFMKAVSDGLKAKGLKPSGNGVADALRSVDVGETDKAVDAISPKALAQLGRDAFDMTLSDTRRKVAGAYKHFEFLDNAMARMPEEFQRESEMKYHRGESQGNPYMDKMANAMRRLQLGAAAEVNRVSREDGVPGTGKLETPDPNYIKGMYQGRDGTPAIVGQGRLEGPKGFLFAKKFANREEAEAAGFKPAGSWVERNLLAYQEQMRYVQIHDAFNIARENGGAKWVMSGGRGPEGFVKGSDSVFQKFGPNKTEVRIATDKHLEEAIERAEQANGITRTTSMNMGCENIARTSGTHIDERFGSPWKVRVHELFHTLDNKYGLYRQFGGKYDRNGRQTGRFEDPVLDKEFKALAAARLEEDSTGDDKRYVSESPEKMAVMGEAYSYAPELMKRLAPNLYDKLDKALDSQPEMRTVKNIKPSLVTGEQVRTMEGPGRVHYGDWWIPGDFNQFLTNFASKGLADVARRYLGPVGAAGVKAAMWTNARMIGARLIGVFHATTASLAGLGSSVGTSLMQAESSLRALAKGDRGEARDSALAAAATAAKGILAPLSVGSQMRKGFKFEREAENTTPRGQLSPDVQNLVAGGERFGRPPSRTQAQIFERTMREFMAGDFMQRVKKALPLSDAYINRGVEKGMKFAMGAARLMGHAVVADQMREVLKDIPGGADSPEGRRALNDTARVGQSIFGQVNYDQLDVNKAVLQGIQLLVQAPVGAAAISISAGESSAIRPALRCGPCEASGSLRRRWPTRRGWRLWLRRRERRSNSGGPANRRRT